ncbi:MAG: restriction endonuclease subunit S, partial [Clostridia bacterium]|nr:restriction endonuclease subunit S [Clostridia bacterium]
VANVQGSYTDLSNVATIKVTSEESAKYRLQAGELLMTEGGDRDKLGRGTIWHGEIDPCLHQNHVFALRTDDKDLLAEYVSFLSDSYVGRDYFDVTANQSVHLASTNSTTILNFAIPFPPIEEQREIITYLDVKTNEIEQLIKSKEQLLAELESYKKSLIYEYVTGKKEVPA